MKLVLHIKVAFVCRFVRGVILKVSFVAIIARRFRRGGLAAANLRVIIHVPAFISLVAVIVIPRRTCRAVAVTVGLVKLADKLKLKGHTVYAVKYVNTV